MKTLLRELIEMVRHLVWVEIKTVAGRVNIIGMILGVILVLALSFPAAMEFMVRLVRPEVRFDVPILELLIAFLVFVLICSFMLVYIERKE